MRAAETDLDAYAGSFRDLAGETRDGVVVVRGGRWRGRLGWVGGEQVALVTWKDPGRPALDGRLYRRVRAACRAGGLPQLEDDPEVEVTAAGEARAKAPATRRKRGETRGGQ